MAAAFIGGSKPSAPTCKQQQQQQSCNPASTDDPRSDDDSDDDDDDDDDGDDERAQIRANYQAAILTMASTYYASTYHGVIRANCQAAVARHGLPGARAPPGSSDMGGWKTVTVPPPRPAAGMSYLAAGDC